MRSTITDQGRDLLAQLELGQITMEFSGIRSGDGLYQSTESLAGLTALKSQKNTYGISNSEIMENGLKLTGVISNTNSDGEAVVTTGYNVNEIGLYVTVNSEEYLYVIAVADNDGGFFLPAYTGSNAVDFIEKFALTISNTQNVTVSLEGAYALASDLEAHSEKLISENGGIHGLRIYETLLQYYDNGVWKNVPTGLNVLQVPFAASTTLTYTGSSQSLSLTGYDAGHMNMTGNISATNVGSYTATFTPAEGYYWSGGDTSAKTISWSIVPAKLTIPVQEGAITYDGTSKTASWSSSYDNTLMTVSGNTGTNAGTYTATFALTDTTNYTWQDGTITNKTSSWEIDKADFTATVSISNYTYAGTKSTPSVSSNPGSGTVTYYARSSSSGASTKWNNVTSTTYDAGTRYLYAEIAETSNYNACTTAQISFTISRATGSCSVSSNSVTVSGSASDSPHQDVTISHTGDGTFSVTSANTAVATVALVSGTTYRITAVSTGATTINVTLAQGTNYTSASKTISVTTSIYSVYGAEWDGTSTTAWSRTDSAQNFNDPSPAISNGSGSSPFDNCMPWSGIERVTDSSAGTLVKIPKFYYKWTRTGSKMKLQIADGPADGFLVSPAHADRGDGSGERDYVYVGAYHCATSTYKSTSGVKPVANITRSSARSSIHNLGSTIWQWDYAMLWTIQMLYLVEYADWNSQAKIGYGCGNSSSTENMGSTDGMTYHTGTNAANRTTYGHTRYRYIEDLWGNVYDWCDGIYFSGADVYCIKNPSSFSDSTGGTKVGTRTTSGGYISKWTTPTASGFEYALYPSEVSGTDSTYVCDYCSYGASGVVLLVGGSYSQGQYRGLFCLDGYGAASSSVADVGSRLQKLP